MYFSFKCLQVIWGFIYLIWACFGLAIGMRCFIMPSFKIDMLLVMLTFHWLKQII